MTKQAPTPPKSKSFALPKLSRASIAGLLGTGVTICGLIVAISQFVFDRFDSAAQDASSATMIAIQSRIAGGDPESPSYGSAPSTATPFERMLVFSSPVPNSDPAREADEYVVLSNRSNSGYLWEDVDPYITSEYVCEGDSAFIPRGRNGFYFRPMTIGYSSTEAHYIKFVVYLQRETASALLHVRVDELWRYAWGLDGRSTYAESDLPRQGDTVRLPVGQCVEVTLDLIEDFGAKPGQEIQAMAFEGDDGRFVFDYVRISGGK